MDQALEFIKCHFVAFATGLLVGFVICLVKFNVPKKVKGESGEDDPSSSDNEFTYSDGSGDNKMVLVVRNDLKMGKGKAAAQCSHAAVMANEAAMRKCPDVFHNWKRNGQKKIVLKVDSESELRAIAAAANAAGLIHAIVRDAGRTQVVSGTRTVIAVGPGPEEIVDKITGHLKLY